MSFLWPPRRGFEDGFPKVVEEIRQWAASGLIKPFDDSQMVDDGFAEILTRIRKHIEGESKPDEIRKEKVYRDWVYERRA